MDGVRARPQRAGRTSPDDPVAPRHRAACRVSPRCPRVRVAAPRRAAVADGAATVGAAPRPAAAVADGGAWA
ncbi:hypothetical protein, partial [Actinomadura rayongensis]|uniref:hypothetical protein n=1 Tax=Actinomadura rayongensis TaxID=1429076 RepID=UPI0035E8CB48